MLLVFQTHLPVASIKPGTVSIHLFQNLLSIHISTKQKYSSLYLFIQKDALRH